MKKQDKPIVPINPILVSERFKTTRLEWLKWQRNILTSEVEKEKQELAQGIKSTPYYLSDEHSRMENTFEIVSKNLEKLERDLHKKYNLSHNFSYYENGSNHFDEKILEYAVEVYNKPREWFQYGDLADYIYVLLNPERKTMRVTNSDSQILAVEAKEKGLTYGMDQELVDLAVEILGFPEITQTTDLIKLKDEMPDVLKLYKFLSLKAPETKINTKNVLWSINQENKYRNDFDKESIMRAYFDELEDYRCLPPQLRIFPVMIIARPELTKRDIELVQKIIKNGSEVGRTKSEIQKYLENLQENLSLEIVQQKEILELYNQQSASTGEPWGDWIMNTLKEAKLEEIHEGLPEEFGKQTLLEAVWINKERRRVVIPEKYKN
ncbi:hypothetical protein ACI1TM_08355 [Lactococcus garvieae]|uniref:hypothetical protein n=1 Tax=Lactococcus garvieae TaxID=1363 RepID=UPI003853DD96